MTRTFRRPFAFQRPASARVGRWYEIKNLSTEMADVAIYDEIGGWGVTASDFSRDLQAITARGITLHINSPGGDVFDGLAILNTLRQHPANVRVVIDGVAASAASFIAMAGDTVEIAPNAMVMIHEASGVCLGSAEDMTEMAALLEKTSANIAQIYAQRAGGDAETWRQAMRAETWYTDQEAVEAGLADSILGSDTPENSAAKVVMNVAPEVDNVVTTSAPDQEPTEEPEAFNFAAFLAQMNAAKEAIARG
jgi:ATP-dependent Clp endopeptidase proteolytic subunit ClpP